MSATITQTNPAAADGEIWLRVHPDCTKRTSLSRTTLYQFMAEGRLKSKKIGGRRVIPASELARFMASVDGSGDLATN